MQAGVSTACMYPKLLEEALYELALNGIARTEMHFNADCELRKPFVSTMRDILHRFDGECVSVHPFTASMEPYMMFTAYKRRLNDIIDYYKRIFDVMQMLGAKVFIFHGNSIHNPVTAEFYCERFKKLADAGKNFGITVAQENVSGCQSGSLKFLREMKSILGEDARFALNVKQAVRAGENPFRMVRILDSSIAHVHISDNGELGDCLLLGQGRFPIRTFLEHIYGVSPQVSVILELYSSNYRGISDLVSNYRMLGRIIQNIQDKDQ